MNRKRLLIAFVVVGLAAAGFAYGGPLWLAASSRYHTLTQPPAAQTGAAETATSADPGQLVASGTIEARAIDISSPNGGRLAAIHVAEGDRVAPGDPIAGVDTTLNEAQLNQAQAAVAQAQAQVALLKAGAAPADIDVARAMVGQAKAAAAAARTTWDDARALVNAPGDLDVRIAQTEAAVQIAETQLKASQAGATSADLQNGLWERTVQSLEQGVHVDKTFQVPNVPGKEVHISGHYDAPAYVLNPALYQWNLSSQQTWQAYAQVDISDASLAAVRQSLAGLRDQKSDPQSLQAQANAAEAAYHQAEAAAATAQANLDVVLAGVQPEQIQAAEALVDQAQNGVSPWQVRLDQAKIKAPRGGTITELVLHEGEVAAAGSPIVRLADLSEVTLTVYVPEPDLGQAHLGQTVEVAVDSFPGRLYPGTVTQVSDQAEFTPKNVQTRDERANTVYAVKITLPNPDGDLKAGMPADAYFCPGSATSCSGPAQPGTPGIEAQVATRLPFAGSAVGQAASSGAGPVHASGTMEGTEINIGGELGGRVIDVTVAEGDRVEAGRTLVRLDAAELEAQYDEALSAVAAARANLATVTAAPQPAHVGLAQAQVAQAEAALAGAQATLGDAQKIRANPQDLDAQISDARSQVALAAPQLDLAQARLKEAQVQQASLPEGTGSDEDKTRRLMYDQQVLAAEAAVQGAQLQQQGAQAVLDRLLDIKQQPVALDAAVHNAEGAVAQAEAGLAAARAVLAQVQASPQPEAVAMAGAKVSQAEAAAALLKATIDKLQLQSPISGTVTAKIIHTGEVARPGEALLTVVDLSRIKLAVYVPESQIGEVKLGQTAQVTVDAYPGRTFTGTVTHIDDQAEFTPKNVQTQEERVKMVFSVEITLDNAGGALKPGMPADAVL